MTRTVDLDVMHDAIIAQIGAWFPTLETVGDYQEDRRTLSVPAVLIELIDMEGDPDADPGTGQAPFVSKWVARVILGSKAEDVKREVRKLAAALGAKVHQQRWGQAVSPAQVTYIGPDAFDPDFDKFEVWAVEWDQQIDLGESVWTGEGVVPQVVKVGWSPDIGPGNEADYSDSVEAAP
ncbi:hypothetical protein [Tritonibacter mobilis]|uniref:hypothetical protein n=1 Tax=Tritonibacter mobilis TaxID=379347 RepID=UPI000806E6E1|nr:hypothetical protein [Tritonibacter mobilis]GLP86298.1 hypothetical protein GCM10007921_18580 [Tritonibacter mobilis]SDX16579.1 hypothetical protein SAMN05444385_105165 [Tritonibacter mobilis]